jgi:hypothetical protein
MIVMHYASFQFGRMTDKSTGWRHSFGRDSLRLRTIRRRKTRQ